MDKSTGGVAADTVAAAARGDSAVRVRVVYATETGTAHDMARRLARRLRARCHGACQVRVVSIAAVTLEDLTGSQDLFVFVVATTGQGDVPESMQPLWRALLRRSLASTALETLRFSVFGLGDSNYAQFNIASRKFVARLLQLQAVLWTPRGEGDEQHQFGLEAGFRPFLQRVVASVQRVAATPGDSSTGHDSGDAAAAIDAAGDDDAGDDDDDDEYAVLPASATTAASPGMRDTPQRTDRKAVHHVPVLENRRLTSLDHFQDVRNIVFDLAATGMSYAPGDVMCVVPRNPPDIATAFLQRMQLDPDMLVVVQLRDPDAELAPALPTASEPCSLQQLAEASLNLCGTPHFSFFQRLIAYCTAPHERERLEYFVSLEGQLDLFKYNQQEHRTVMEVLDDFKSARIPLASLVDVVGVIRPRSFSIASAMSPCASPTARLCVAVVRYRSRMRRVRRGLCSNYLAGCAVGQRVRVWCKASSLRISAGAMLLIGPGTGVAPFMSFIAARQDQVVAGGAGRASITLVRGHRFKLKDDLYGPELAAMQAHDPCCLADVWTAYSREQAHPRTGERMYVQDVLLETHGADVWRLVSGSDVCIYVSGAAGAMPRDVRAAFVSIAQRHGGLDEAAAGEYVAMLERQRRYHVETWF